MRVPLPLGNMGFSGCTSRGRRLDPSLSDSKFMVARSGHGFHPKHSCLTPLPAGRVGVDGNQLGRGPN